MPFRDDFRDDFRGSRTGTQSHNRDVFGKSGQGRDNFERFFVWIFMQKKQSGLVGLVLRSPLSSWWEARTFWHALYWCKSPVVCGIHAFRCNSRFAQFSSSYYGLLRKHKQRDALGFYISRSRKVSTVSMMLLYPAFSTDDEVTLEKITGSLGSAEGFHSCSRMLRLIYRGFTTQEVITRSFPNMENSWLFCDRVYIVRNFECYDDKIQMSRQGPSVRFYRALRLRRFLWITGQNLLRLYNMQLFF